MMALQILENNGTFYLQGNINATTSQHLIIHIEQIATNAKEVTLDIGNITEIDDNGVSALKKLFLNALRNKKTFSIVGEGCKELYTDFNTPNAA